MSPTRAARICSAPGCGAIVERGRCPKHTVKRHKDPEQHRFYGSRQWTLLSRLVRAQEPTCRMCGNAPSAVTDHIDGDWSNNVRENLRGLCVACNASHTSQQHNERQR